MGFKQLEKDFNTQVNFNSVVAHESSSDDVKAAAESTFRYWQLRLLFEIAGNLDSLVVSHRAAEKHVDRMASAYSELVKLQKDKAANK